MFVLFVLCSNEAGWRRIAPDISRVVVFLLHEGCLSTDGLFQAVTPEEGVEGAIVWRGSLRERQIFQTVQFGFDKPA